VERQRKDPDVALDQCRKGTGKRIKNARDINPQQNAVKQYIDAALAAAY
jgi:hypothetical protein